MSSLLSETRRTGRQERVEVDFLIVLSAQANVTHLATATLKTETKREPRGWEGPRRAGERLHRGSTSLGRARAERIGGTDASDRKGLHRGSTSLGRARAKRTGGTEASEREGPHRGSSSLGRARAQSIGGTEARERGGGVQTPSADRRSAAGNGGLGAEDAIKRDSADLKPGEQRRRITPNREIPLLGAKYLLTAVGESPATKEYGLECFVCAPRDHQVAKIRFDSGGLVSRNTQAVKTNDPRKQRRLSCNDHSPVVKI